MVVTDKAGVRGTVAVFITPDQFRVNEPATVGFAGVIHALVPAAAGSAWTLARLVPFAGFGFRTFEAAVFVEEFRRDRLAGGIVDDGWFAERGETVLEAGG